MNKTKKIAIVGLGPVGMVLAVHLKNAGHNVALFVRSEEKKEIISDNGIVLSGFISAKAEFQYVFDDISKLKDFDAEIIISAVKSHQISLLLEMIEPYISKNTLMVCAQNGIDTENEYSTLFNKSHLLRMVINFAGRLKNPYETEVTFFNAPNYIAPLNERLANTSQIIASSLIDNKLDTLSCSYIELKKNIWEKTILNSSLSALCALSKLTMLEVMSDPDLLLVVRQTIEESIEVAQKEGVNISDDFLDYCMIYLTKAGDHFPSLAVDFMNNKSTEIDLFNGKIVAYSKNHNLRTPINSAFTSMMRAMTAKAKREQLNQAI
ncbi:MAG: 2-dehydropantoate 2-reductase [Flavobacteriales bacterium]|nr:2-dehydropantoate 2-reductase [Flavobacteriales bacterium]